MMKREMDLIRDILLRVEQGTGMKSTELERELENWSHQQISYHLGLLVKQGFLSAITVNPMERDTYWLNLELTFSGHDFLDSIRDPEIWSKTKQTAHKAGGFTLELLGDLAKGFIRKKIKDHTDIDLI